MLNILKVILFTALFYTAIAGAFTAVLADARASEPPAIMHAKKYASGVVVADYLVSEKLDGVRARWNGKQLISRNGKIFAAPDWFVSDFPSAVLDGELWLGRGQYQQTVSVVSQQQPHQGWQQLKFMVFDLPAHPQPFAQRYAQLKKLGEQSRSRFFEVIAQQRVASHRQLMVWLDEVTSAGGEGLMLHHQGAQYVPGRSAHILKLKKFDDAEAVVVGYKAGKGKYLGRVGSLKVRMANGKQFYVGSGLTDALRGAPPALGSVITYRHQGFTDQGKV